MYYLIMLRGVPVDFAVQAYDAHAKAAQWSTAKDKATVLDVQPVPEEPNLYETSALGDRSDPSRDG